MVKLESHDPTVRYGDKVHIVNRSYGGQKLCQYGSWLSTSGNTSEFWVIERG
jgi:hypothetical protein